MAGQAKRRGSYEERVAQAKEKKRFRNRVKSAIKNAVRIVNSWRDEK